VRQGSPVVGKAIYELKLPRDYLVVLIARGEDFLIPNGSIVLQPNDRMLGLARADTHQKVLELVEHGRLEDDAQAGD